MASLRPFRMMDARVKGLRCSLAIASAISTGLVGSKNKAVFFPNWSSTPSICPVSTGQPRENASRGGKLSGPNKEGYTSAEALR